MIPCYDIVHDTTTRVHTRPKHLQSSNIVSVRHSVSQILLTNGILMQELNSLQATRNLDKCLMTDSRAQTAEHRQQYMSCAKLYSQAVGLFVHQGLTVTSYMQANMRVEDVMHNFRCSHLHQQPKRHRKLPATELPASSIS